MFLVCKVRTKRLGPGARMLLQPHKEPRAHGASKCVSEMVRAQRTLRRVWAYLQERE